jgi:hypothetical protein
VCRKWSNPEGSDGTFWRREKIEMLIAMGMVGREAGVYRHHQNLFLVSLLIQLQRAR